MRRNWYVTFFNVHGRRYSRISFQKIRSQLWKWRGEKKQTNKGATIHIKILYIYAGNREEAHDCEFDWQGDYIMSHGPSACGSPFDVTERMSRLSLAAGNRCNNIGLNQAIFYAHNYDKTYWQLIAFLRQYSFVGALKTIQVRFITKRLWYHNNDTNFIANFERIIEMIKKTSKGVATLSPLWRHRILFVTSQNLVCAIGGRRLEPPRRNAIGGL